MGVQPQILQLRAHVRDDRNGARERILTRLRLAAALVEGAQQRRALHVARCDGFRHLIQVALPNQQMPSSSQTLHWTLCTLFPQVGTTVSRQLQRRIQLENYTVNDRRHIW